MKIHLCCGDVYLKGYQNIDIQGEKVGKKLIQPTTLDKYYVHPFDTNKRQRPIVVDRRMDITKNWNFLYDSIQEIVLICAIEHFNAQDAKHIVSEAYRSLKKGGKLIIDTPDTIKTVVNYHKYPDLMSRLLLCSQKNEYSYHKVLYTSDSFNLLLGDKWSKIEDKLVVQHDYPMIGRVCTK